MPGGTAWLIAWFVLVVTGWGTSWLERWGIQRSHVAWFLAALIAASLWNVTFAEAPSRLVVNVGGVVVPLILCFILMFAIPGQQLARSLLAAACCVVFMLWGMEFLPQLQLSFTLVPPGVVYGTTAAILAYCLVPDYRSSLFASLFGIVVADGVRFILLVFQPDGTLGWWGGDITFDSLVFAGMTVHAIDTVVRFITSFLARVQEIGDHP